MAQKGTSKKSKSNGVGVKTNSESKSKITRSRNGCHNCKRLKIKCDEAKPSCSYCQKTKSECDYSIKLTWGGRPYKNSRKQNREYSTPMSFADSSESMGKQKDRTDIDSLKFVVEDFNGPNSSFNTSKDFKFTTMSISNSLASEMSVTSMSSSGSLKRSIQENDQIQKSRKQKTPGYKSPKLLPELNSPTSFITPNGESILSNFNNYNLEETSANNIQALDSVNSMDITGFNYKANANISEKERLQSRSESNNDYPVMPSNSPIFKYYPEISDGVESLSMALGSVGNVGHSLLKNSGLFSTYVDEVIKPVSDFNNTPQSTNLTESDPHFEFNSNVDSISNYSDDLKSTQDYLSSNHQSNLTDSWLDTSYSFLRIFNTGNKNIHELEEEENDDNDDNNNNELFSKSKSDIDNLDSSPDPEGFKEEGKLIKLMHSFESIPPSLSPLPEILLRVPFYRSLMHFWVDVASDNLVPAPSHVYKDNPFKVLLPQMAMECPSILTTLLAFAASARASLTGDEFPTEILDQLIARSCDELVKLLKDQKSSTSDEALATVLLLSCYELFNSKNRDGDRHRFHTIGARQIIKARRLSASPSIKHKNDENELNIENTSNLVNSKVGTESDIAFFLIRWFVYVDIIGALSTTKNAQDYLSSDEQDSYEPVTSVAQINRAGYGLKETIKDPKRDIDHLLGFDVQFLPQFKEVALLIRKTDTYLNSSEGENKNLPIEIISKALEVKDAITKSFEIGEARRQEKIDKMIDFKTGIKRKSNDSSFSLSNLIEQDNILRCTNKMFSDMAILNLYRRVLRIPRNSPIVQDLANGVLEIVEKYIESKSSAEICSIFCIFCAGCETLNPQMRAFMLSRFRKLSKMGIINATRSIPILTRCWETGEDWIDASKHLDIDIALL